MTSCLPLPTSRADKKGTARGIVLCSQGPTPTPQMAATDWTGLKASSSGQEKAGSPDGGGTAGDLDVAAKPVRIS